MKDTSGLWLAALFVLAMLGVNGTARAQTLTVKLSSDGTQSLTAGSTFSNGGAITVRASAVPSGATVSIASVSVSVGNAGIFDSLTLSGSAPGGSSDASLPLASGANAASFSSIQLSDGQSATFTLNGTVTSNPPASTGGLSRWSSGHFKQASMLSPGPGGALSMVVLGLLMIAALACTGKLRRRHLIMLAVWMVMAAAVAGCGNGGSASSDQQVTAISATSSSGGTVNVTGLPMDMGTITLELNETTGGVAVPTPNQTPGGVLVPAPNATSGGALVPAPSPAF